MICPDCGEGKLSPTFKVEKTRTRGIEGDINFNYSICDECESEFIGPEDRKKNLENLEAFINSVNERVFGVGGLPIKVQLIDGQEYVSFEDFQLVLKFKNLQISHLKRYIDENCPIKEIE